MKVPAGAVQSFAMGINDKGHVVGYWRTPDSDRWIGFLNKGKKKQVILEVDEGDTRPYFINNAGDVIGETGGEFFYWRKGAFTPIDQPDGASSWQITGFNNQGKIVGFYFDTNGRAVAFIGTPEKKGKKPRKPQQQ